jgi:hypothetical protein
LAEINFKARIDKVSTEAIIKKLGGLKAIITKKDADEIGRNCVEAMLEMIGKGTSPIQGNGRFPRYKNKLRYPGKANNKRGKLNSPVNLKLTGQFLNALNYKVMKTKEGYSVSIGFDDRLAQKKEQGHREGVNGQPERPTIPQPKNGETFARLVQQEYLTVIEAAVKRFTS